METSGKVQDLAKRVVEKAREEAAAIADRTQRAVEREVQDARRQAEERLAGVRALAEAASEAKRRSAITGLRLLERGAVMTRQEAAVAEVFRRALEELRAAPPGGERRAMLAELVREAVGMLGERVARVRMNAADRADALANGFPGEIGGAEIRIEDDTIDSAGGAVVADESLRVMIDNTFEARLDRQRGALRMLVANRLNLRGTEP